MQAASYRRRLICCFQPRVAVWMGGLLLLAVSLPAWAEDTATSAEIVARRIAKRLLLSVVDEYGDQYHDVEAAVVAFKEGNADGARHLFQLAKDAHPELPPADVMIAKLHVSANQAGSVQRALDRASLTDPADPEAVLIASELALAGRQYVLSELGYQRAQVLVEAYDVNEIRRSNLIQRVHAGKASLYETRGEHGQAIEQLQAWMALDPENPVPAGSLGRIHFARGDMVGARDAFGKLAALDPDAPPVDIAMARLFLDANKIEQAQVALRDAVKKNGSDVRTRLTVAELALQAGQIDLAKESVEHVLSKNENTVAGQVLQARIARIEGQQDEAEALLRKAIVSFPNAFVISNELARTFASAAGEDTRKLGLQYAIKNVRDPKNRGANRRREALMTMAWCLMQNGYADKAEKTLEQLRDGGTISSENAYIAAKIYAALGKRKAAVNALKATLANRRAFPGRTDAEKLLADLSDDSSL